eukprot:4319482-Amphidinium_carterae.1
MSTCRERQSSLARQGKLDPTAPVDTNRVWSIKSNNRYRDGSQLKCQSDNLQTASLTASLLVHRLPSSSPRFSSRVLLEIHHPGNKTPSEYQPTYAAYLSSNQANAPSSSTTLASWAKLSTVPTSTGYSPVPTFAQLEDLQPLSCITSGGVEDMCRMAHDLMHSLRVATTRTYRCTARSVEAGGLAQGWQGMRDTTS